MRFLLPALLVSGATAFACSYSMVLWQPSSDADPPYYRIWGGKKEGWIDRTEKRVSPVLPPDAGLCGAPIILPLSAVPSSVSRLEMLSGAWKATAPSCQHTFIDERGEIAGRGTFEDAGNFHEGLAAVRVGKVWGYVDQNLSIVIPPQFRGADAFSEGLAAVNGEAGVSYIDRAGRVVIPGPFDQAAEFHEGVAAVDRDRRAYYIDRTGRQAVPGTYMYAARFFHGIANVNFGKSAAYIDRQGA